MRLQPRYSGNADLACAFLRVWWEPHRRSGVCHLQPAGWDPDSLRFPPPIQRDALDLSPGEKRAVGALSFSRRRRQCRSCITSRRLESRGAMARKAKAPRPDRTAERADYKTWLADAVAALQRAHNINPSIIPMRVWRHLYIQGRSPQEAAERAAVSAHNVRSAADRLRGRQR
jgi:hypothetical protein